MALTIFHVTLVWPLFILKPKKFDFLGLTMGATIPDIFLPFTLTLFPQYYWDVRIVTHSLIGAVTLDLLLGALAALFIVPAIIISLKKRYKDPRFYTFAGVDIIKARPGKIAILYSVLIGTISHVFLDIFFHLNHPILYPYGYYEILLFNDLNLTVFMFSLVLIFGFLLMAYFHWLKLLKNNRK